jgi:FeS assembly SUF system protein
LGPEKHQPRRQNLTVLPHSGKVDELRAEARQEQQSNQQALSPAVKPMQTQDSNKTDEQKQIEQKVIDAVSTVYDPEIPVNIYELGLIYHIDVAEDNSVKVKMTLTAPGCPVAGSLPIEVENRISMIPEVPRAEVELVWDPPWTKDRMSEEARLALGFL